MEHARQDLASVRLVRPVNVFGRAGDVESSHGHEQRPCARTPTAHRPATGRNAQAGPEASDEAPARDIHALPEGFRLFDYEIVGTIGENGSGIVYLAWDHVLEQHVAVREYLPGALAARDRASAAVVAKSKGQVAAFQAGLCSFVNQARMLARFEHPSLPRVLHFWEGNGTAYVAMPYYEGATLARALVELGGPPDEAQLCSWLRPLLDALGTLHASECVHGGIATHRILLTDEGPVLTAFGGWRMRAATSTPPCPICVRWRAWCTRPSPVNPRRAATIGCDRSPKWRAAATAGISWMRSMRRCHRSRRAVARVRPNSGTGSAAPTIAGIRTSTC